MALKEICGCIHLHTTFSDGGCDYDTIIKAAKTLGLDFVCVTDHMSLEGANREGQYDDVYVLVGYEHEDEKRHNHYLVFGINDVIADVADPQKYIDRVKEMGGTGFLAHPAEKRNYIKTLPPYPWTRWDAQRFDGVEIWNQISDWMEQLHGWRSFPKLFFPNCFIGGAPPELLKKWDEMNLTRFVSAIGGVDAHSRKFSLPELLKRWDKVGKSRMNIITIFPIKTEMRGVRTHLLVDETDWSDEKKKGDAMIAAMRNGKSFMSNFSRGDARGCKMFLRDGNGNEEYPGRPTNTLSFPMTMHVDLTQKAKIRLIRNGGVIQSTVKKSAMWPITEPGVYRIEAYRGSGAWIYSNPFPVGQYPHPE